MIPGYNSKKKVLCLVFGIIVGQFAMFVISLAMLIHFPKDKKFFKHFLSFVIVDGSLTTVYLAYLYFLMGLWSRFRVVNVLLRYSGGEQLYFWTLQYLILGADSGYLSRL